ncbi:hypothetical protein H1P_2110013 [Hyella patelloides LEGE 07179]|uniref:Uncharacterized protein n=1 Tax=Hyella patelloides LEGE 07179 TaxID=945734 RepID=A0A563VQE0_9CYAN|nr:hypothetical protein H1P_2110013 [Hyella patelloides LEGE 07179]
MSQSISLLFDTQLPYLCKGFEVFYLFSLQISQLFSPKPLLCQYFTIIQQALIKLKLTTNNNRLTISAKGLQTEIVGSDYLQIITFFKRKLI